MDTDGTIVGASKIARDITDRKRAERAQRDYAKILDLAQFFVRDMQGRIVQWSLGAERLYGYTRAEAVGQPFHELLRATFPEPLEVINERLLGTDSWEGELTHYKRDGTEITVASVWVLQRDVKGDSLQVLEANTDVTNRIRTDQKLAARVFRLELFNNITRAIGKRQDLTSIFQVVIKRLEEHLAIDFGCVCLYDPQEKHLTIAVTGTYGQDIANNITLPASTDVGTEPDGLTRSLRGEVAYEPDLAGVNAPFLQHLASGGIRALVAAPLRIENEVYGILITGRREPQSFSGADREFLVQLSEHVALATHQTRLHGALLTAYEAMCRTQAAVIQQERMRALGQMASGIAHDINNALSPAALYADMLLAHDANLSPESREYLGVIQRAIDDVAASVARMRQFHRQREPHGTRTIVDLNRTIEQVVDLTRARWNTMPQERGVVVHMETVLAPDLPLILGSEVEIRNALANLILNAVDAMPAGGTVSVRSRAFTPDKVCIEVSDTGIGMDDATRSHCIEPFFTTKNARGSGLGLAMVYGMLERHGGEIEIASELGRGAAMRLTFPIPAIETTRGAGIIVPLAPSRPLRILLVDDDATLLKSLRVTLERDGHIVVAAGGGQQGIAAFHKDNENGQPFDVVITDLGMPYVDGRAVAAAVKSSKRDVPVILLTGWGRRMIEENDTPPHVNRVLSKPPKTEQLRSALAELTHKGPLESLAASLG